jgi:hypothetical protein
MSASHKNSSSSRKSGLLALIGLVAIASIKLGLNGGADTRAASDTHEMECNVLSRCPASLRLVYPGGDGLVVTPIIDEVF